MINETSSDLWLERSTFAGEFIGGIAYGIHVAIFSATLYFMTRSNATGRISKTFFVLTCALFTLGTITVSAKTKFYQLMWIDDRDIAGGPPSWILNHYNNPVETLADASYITANFLADGALIYRLYVVWNNSLLIIIVPVLGFLASTAFSILTLFQSERPGANLWTHTTVQFAVPYWSMTIAINATMTLAIAYRLMSMRRRVTTMLGAEHARTYTSVVAMIVESAAVYSVTGLVFIICYARKSNVQNLVLPILDQVVCIAPELILLRVACGRAWTKQTSSTIMGNRETLGIRPGEVGDSIANLHNTSLGTTLNHSRNSSDFSLSVKNINLAEKQATESIV